MAKVYRARTGIDKDERELLCRALQEMVDVMAPTLKAEMRLTQAQSGARIRAKQVLRIVRGK